MILPNLSVACFIDNQTDNKFNEVFPYEYLRE